MPKEDMLELIHKEYKALSDRGNVKNDIDILENYKFYGEADAESKNELEPFKKILPDKILLF